ncbi:MAG TPA: TetR/AcrR family transcriptional regulator [Candidatus Saccharimonadia bacterium]|jgi:AcrR family transcriptional regulator
MSQESNSPLRHKPKQARGQRKVDHILRVAEGLFAEAGFENVTTNAVAARAGISIGSLYQFFSGKDTILEAIADRYIEQVTKTLDKNMAERDDMDMEPFMRLMIDHVIKQQEQRPFFLQSLATSRPSKALSVRVDQMMEEYAQQLVNRWRRRHVDEKPAVMKLRARVCVRIITGLVPLALQARGRERDAIVNEIHLAVVCYLTPMVKNESAV